MRVKSGIKPGLLGLAITTIRRGGARIERGELTISLAFNKVFRRHSERNLL